MSVSEDHLPNLTPEQALELGEVDLAIMEILTSLEEVLADIPGLEPVDRSLIVHHVRWSFISGWEARNELTP
jgi:hypothetical protein